MMTKNLIEEINKHNTNNLEIMEELNDIIVGYNINSEEELLEFEKSNFNNYNLDEILNELLDIYYADTSIYEYYDIADLAKLEDYENLIKASNNIHDKCLYTLLLLDYARIKLYLPYQAYKLILNDELKGEYDEYFYNLDFE